MLEMMFFYDGNLKDITETEMETECLIDAGDGYTNNLRSMFKVITDNKCNKVITNQVELLDNKWLWDTKIHAPKLCLRDSKDGKWKPVGRFTKKDIKNSTNLIKMFTMDEFRDYAYKAAAERVPRDLLRFRIKDKEESEEE